MVVLWTDLLIGLLVAAAAGLAWQMRRSPAMRRPLRQIAASGTAMVSLVVLLFFVGIGLLDSVHFYADRHDNSKIISALDYCLAPLDGQLEKTYSAPFAARLYSKQRVDGGQWQHPRLVYGGRHLSEPERQRVADIALKAAVGLAQGLAVAALLCLAAAWALGGSSASWPPGAKAAGRAVFLIITLIGLIAHLSAHYHVLGTDKVGESVLYQSLKSVRTGLVIGTLTTLVMLPMAVVFGLLAGFFQGWVDDAIQYLYTTLNAVPSVLLIAAAVLLAQVYIANHEQAFTSLLLRADLRLLVLCLLLGVTNWTGLCRLLRAETLKLREMEYVQAATALGVGQRTILARHILPNVMHIVLIAVVLDFSALVLAEAVLSYINIGVDPATHSWGNMINNARLEMAREPMVWWSLAAAFGFMFALVLAANVFADSVQAAFDPRRGGGH